MASVMSEMETTKMVTSYSDLEVESMGNGNSSPQSQFDELVSKPIKQELIDGRNSSASTPSASSYSGDLPGKSSPLSDMAVTSIGTPSTSSAPPQVKLPTPAITISGQISQAGRKKSNPAWEFFNDLRPQGVNAVKCRYCEFCSEDRSPSAMRLHIRKAHDTGIGGLWYQLEQKTLQQVPHKYTKNKEMPGFIGKKRDSRDSNFSDVNNSYYDDALIAAAKAFLLQNTSASSNGNDDQSNTSFLNALIQNPQAMQQVAEVLNAQSTPATQEQNPSSSVIKTEQPDVEMAEDDANSSMPVFEISNLTANSQDSAIFDSRESTLLSLQEPPKLDSKPTNSRANKWVNLGSFTNEADMLAVRTKEKVSKRRTEQLKNGTKVRYRCNKWKKTKCAYQMYAFYWPEGKIDLYESGEHDHSGKNLGLYQGLNQAKPNPPMNPQPLKLSQEEILNSLLMQLNSGNSQA